MWAQIVKSRMKPGAEHELDEIREQMRTRIGQRPGLLHSFWMQNQKDPQEYYTLIVFESEEQARQGEREIESDPVFQRIRGITEGMPDFVDLNVIDQIP